MSIFSGWSHWLWVLQRYFTWQNLGLHVHVHVGAGSVISHRLKCYTMRACFMSTVSSTYMYTVSQHSYKARCEAGFYIYSIMNYQYSIFFFFITQHCTLDGGSYTKDLSMVNEDLSSVFILDNSPGAYRYNPGKSIM